MILAVSIKQINDTPIDNVQDAILALSEDIDPIMLTLSRSAGQLTSPLHTMQKIKGPLKLNNNSSCGGPSPNSSKISNHASTSSLKSDKSDHCNPNNNNSRTGDRHQLHQSGNSSSKQGGLRDIFRVKLQRKKLSSPEAEILETLDSAIASGGNPNSNATSTSSAHRKTRKKRTSSRVGAGGDNSNPNKNGTWPRVMLAKNSACSYTLPHNGGNGGNEEMRSMTNDNHYGTLSRQQQQQSNNFYPATSGSGHYIQNANLLSNTVCLRRPVNGKERVSLQSLGWDINPEGFRQQFQQQQQQQLQQQYISGGGGGINSKSVGAINSSSTGNSGNKANLSLLSSSGRESSGNENSMTLTRSNNNRGLIESLGGHDLGLRSRGNSSQIPQYYRYSMGVFDQPDSRTKIGKG